MNEYDYISPSEQLSAFLDGELEPAESSRLFMDLAQDPDLQTEMQDMVNLRTGMQQLQSAPPQKAKDNIIATAGLGAAGGAAAGFLSRGLWQGLLTGKPLAMLLTGLVTAFTTLFVIDYNEKNQPEAPLAQDFPPPPAAQSSFVAPAEPQQIKVVYVDRNVYVRPEEKISLKSDISDNMAENIEDNKDVQKGSLLLIPAGMFSKSSENNLSQNDELLNFENYSGYKTLASTLKGQDFWKDLAVQFRMQGQAARSFPETQLSSLSNPTLNNVAFALFYDIDSRNSIGLEIGQENFLQIYEGIEYGSAVSYEQNYIGFWIGASYKHVFDNIEPLFNLQPLAQVTLGGNIQGPVMKAMLGMQYNFENKIYIFGGLDGGTLLYKYQNEMFTSSKLGFSYGMSVKF